MEDFFQDISSKFVEHYFELAKKDVNLLKTFYTDESILEFNSESTKTPSSIIEKIKSLGDIQAPQPIKFSAQPFYDKTQIIITANATISGKPCVMTFILKELNEEHRLGITHHLISQ